MPMLRQIYGPAVTAPLIPLSIADYRVQLLPVRLTAEFPETQRPVQPVQLYRSAFDSDYPGRPE